jgi:excisionase family DNA binding protein
MNQITLDLSGLDQAIQTAVSDAISKAIAGASTLETTEQSDRLNVDEACQLLNRTRSWLFKKTMDREIPFSKFGSRLVFSRKDLQAWMDQQTIPVLNPGDVMSDRLAASAKRKAL